VLPKNQIKLLNKHKRSTRSTFQFTVKIVRTTTASYPKQYEQLKTPNAKIQTAKYQQQQHRNLTKHQPHAKSTNGSSLAHEDSTSTAANAEKEQPSKPKANNQFIHRS
jgi:hypothetical protein